MYFLHLSLNILSMMGLMLAVGMLVDNAVVVTESIHRHQLIDPNGDKKKSVIVGVDEVALVQTERTVPRWDAAKVGVMAGSALSAAVGMTLLIVFLPKPKTS